MNNVVKNANIYKSRAQLMFLLLARVGFSQIKSCYHDW